MNLLRIGTSTLNQLPLDFDGNKSRIIAAIEAARAKGVQLLCLPELSLSGYGCEDAFFNLSHTQAAEASLRDILPATEGIAVLLGLPVFYQGGLYNCAAMVFNRHILGVNAKRQLPREGVHYESRWFRPWNGGDAGHLTLCDQKVPLGDQYYKFGDVGVGIEICEEAWGSASMLASQTDDIDIILNPSASHFALGKATQREVLVSNSSRALRVFYAYANLVGLESGNVIYDGGCLISHNGSIASRGKRFGFSDSDLNFYDANLDLVRIGKISGRAIDSKNSQMLPSKVETQPMAATKQVAAIDRQKVIEADAGVRDYNENEEFLQAEMLGLFDYLRKSKAQGYVVSLSGGCDSGSAATLIGHMLACAVKELGMTEAVKRLGLRHSADLQKAEDLPQLIKSTLFCLYQKSANSGAATEKAAAGLAEALGAGWASCDIAPTVAHYTSEAEKALGQEFSWDSDDLTLQNIQARSRSPLAWMIANARNAILIATSNRSEAAVGYATMDGDTSGGLSPLGGIDKKFLRLWLRWAETDNRLGLGPLPVLKLINEMPPTAELRPEEQQDEIDLMPYDVLERIERYFIRDRMGLEDILMSIVADFPDVSETELLTHLNRFMRLWQQNQWKRERYAPSFHMDDLSLDPKSWCRYPILAQPLRLEAPQK